MDRPGSQQNPRMTAPAALALAFALGGCAEEAPITRGELPPPNATPWVVSADAWVYWDGGAGDDVWAFDAYADDPDGLEDVVEVWADVWDEARGVQAASFPLYPTDEPGRWFSDWAGLDARLDPFYEGYSVDIVAYDRYGAAGGLTFWADTYGETEPEPEPAPDAPSVVGGQAGVLWDEEISAAVWYFDAEVADPDGVLDVAQVWADVWDEATGRLLVSFELERTAQDPFWSAKALGEGSGLDPYYPDYTVDLVAYDGDENSGYLTVEAAHWD